MKRSSPFPGTVVLSAAGIILLLLLLDAALFCLLPLRLLVPPAPDRSSLPVTAAAVLFHDFAEAPARLSAESRRRLHYGMALFNSGQADMLLVAGGNRTGRQENGARLMASYLRRRGIPAVSILVEDTSLDTRTNLAAIRGILEARGVGSAGLVSSPWHLLRIRALDLPGAQGLALLPYPVASAEPPLDRKDAWLSAHYNFAAWVAAVLLPEGMYQGLVRWVREHTTF